MNYLKEIKGLLKTDYPFDSAESTDKFTLNDSKTKDILKYQTCDSEKEDLEEINDY